MRILVTGKKGQLLSAIRAVNNLNDLELITLGKPDFDLCFPDKLSSEIEKISPDLVISAAAYTAVDNAETERQKAKLINEIAPKKIAIACKKIGAPLIHISTDCVFSGEKELPYIETDIAEPINYYGQTKLNGEQEIINLLDDYVILRTSWVFSEFGSNFVTSMLKLGAQNDEIRIVNDQFGNPTYAPELAKAILKIAKVKHKNKLATLSGVFHITGNGSVSRFQWGEKIFETKKNHDFNNVKVYPIPTSEYPTPAIRPKNAILNCNKLESVYGIRLNSWQLSLKECIDKIIANKVNNK